MPSIRTMCFVVATNSIWFEQQHKSQTLKNWIEKNTLSHSWRRKNKYRKFKSVLSWLLAAVRPIFSIKLAQIQCYLIKICKQIYVRDKFSSKNENDRFARLILSFVRVQSEFVPLQISEYVVNIVKGRLTIVNALQAKSLLFRDNFFFQHCAHYSVFALHTL